MVLLSATDVAIAMAIKTGTLVVSEHTGRFGQYWAISDDRGLIEIANSAAEAEARISALR